MDGRSSQRGWMALLVLALAVRLAAGAWWQQRLPEGRRFFFPDSESYWSLGHSIARGEPYVFGQERAYIFRTPGYPLILAGLIWLGGEEQSPYVARFSSALLGTCAVAAVYALANSIFDESAARLAGIWAALDPGSVSQGVFVLSEAPFCPLLVWQLWLWWQADRVGSTSAANALATGSGLVAGLATLMRPSWLLFLPFAGVSGCFLLREKSKHCRLVAWMLLGLSLAMSPWWWRNYQLTGHFIPTTLQVGASLYDGLHPRATGASDMSFVPHFLRASSSDKLPGTPEEQLNARLQSAAMAWARAHPRRVLELAAIKFWRIWSPWPNADDVGGFWPGLALACGFLPVMVVLLAGFRRAVVDHPRLWLLMLPAIYFTLLHCVFVGSVRYRQPAMLLLAVVAAGIAMQWWRGRTALSIATATLPGNEVSR